MHSLHLVAREPDPASSDHLEYQFPVSPIVSVVPRTSLQSCTVGY